MTLTLQPGGSQNESPESPLFYICVGLARGLSLRLSLILQSARHTSSTDMARGRGKTKQSSLRAAGMLPMLKKPTEAIGHNLHVPGAYWDKCPAADKEKVFACLVREFDALHKFAGGQAPSAAFEVQEMGETGTGSLEPGVASGEVFWIKYPLPALEYFYAANPEKMPGAEA